MTVHGTVRNTTQQRLCYVQAEPHLKMETKTVGELGPDKLEDLDPGQQAATSLVATGVSFDGYVIHMEVFDCGGPGPMPQTGGEGAEGSGGGSGPALAPDETYDGVIGGARLVLSYDASANAFTGAVENTSCNVLTNVRVEVHLSNGAELGPVFLPDLFPGARTGVRLPSTPEAFDTWTAHAEVGSGEGRRLKW